MFFLVNRTWILVLAAAVSLLALFTGCATVETVDDDPCADWRGGGGTRMTGGGYILHDYALKIPFRVRVLDADTDVPVQDAFAAEETFYAGEAWLQEARWGTADGDGVVDGIAWTLVGTPNPYHPCYRRRFRGILVGVMSPGYRAYRGYVPLPAAEGQRVDWGTIYLKRSEDSVE